MPEEDEDKTPKVPAGYKSPEEIARIAADEKEQGRRAGVNALLKDLGLETEGVEGLKSILTAARTAADSKKDEVTRLTEENTKLKSEVETHKAATIKAERGLSVFKALVTEGAKAETMEDVELLLRLDPEADEAAVKKAITDVKGKYPNFFAEVKDDGKGGDGKGNNGTGTEGNRGTAAAGSGSGAPPNPGAPSRQNGNGGDDRSSRARSLLDERHPNRAKQKP